ncbi:MAG: hypothetical protein ACKN9K_18220 [Dolichospermum sp.]
MGGIFTEDGLSQGEISQLVDTFPHQSIDFLNAGGPSKLLTTRKETFSKPI